MREFGAPVESTDEDVLLDLPRVGSYSAEGGKHAPPGQAPEYGVVEYFGEPLRVVLDPLSLELTLEEFMDKAAMLEGTEDPRSLGVVRQFLRTVIHPDDFNTFWRLVREHRQDTMAQMGFGKWLVEQIGGHPFVEPSGSGTGQSSTAPNSTDDVSLRVQGRLEEAGRADLALVVLQHREQVAMAG